MRDPENISAVANLPIDLMGFIFYEKSPRYVRSISVPLVSANVQRVGVFVNADYNFVLEKIKTHQLKYLQLHGDETPEYCHNIQTKNQDIQLIKAFRVNEDFDFSQTKKYEPYCAYFLFDTKKKTNAVLPPTPSKGGDFSLREKLLALSSPPLEGAGGWTAPYGGTGEKFNWQLLQQYTGNTPFLLSGGIGAEDAEAVQKFSHPKFAGIDVNSKFELEPALKDVQKIENFLSVVVL